MCLICRPFSVCMVDRSKLYDTVPAKIDVSLYLLFEENQMVSYLLLLIYAFIFGASQHRWFFRTIAMATKKRPRTLARNISIPDSQTPDEIHCQYTHDARNPHPEFEESLPLQYPPPQKREYVFRRFVEVSRPGGRE